MRSTKPVLILAMAVVTAAASATAALGIVGGITVQQAPPWVGSLQVAGGGHECGAALVSSGWAVTAKHCLEVNLTQARFGSLDYRTGGQLVGIAGAVTDPTGNDVALLRLASTVTGTPVTIASSSPTPGTGVTLLGWGQTAPQPGASPASPLLQQLQTQVLPASACSQQEQGFNPDGELCIGSTPTQTACYGDSGGPAVVNGALVGVTSRGSRICGNANSTYENVTALRAWILQTAGASAGGDGQGQGQPSAAPAAQPPPATAPAPSTTATPVPTAPTLDGLHIMGNWRVRATPGGTPSGVVHDGEVVTVDCQATGPQLRVAGLGTSAIWDHLPDRGFVTNLAVIELQGQAPDPRLPACTSPPS
jgi:hypothetical protein